jgi:CubicO group peptidase (beta-lactamase class C family)
MAASRQQVEPVLQQAGLLTAATGVAVACTSPKSGSLTWTRGRLTDGTEIEPGTPMYAASVSKQVIGALTAQQVLADRLRADDRVVDLLPALPGWAHPIRVRHLVHHTSGLPSTARLLTAVGLDDEHSLTNDLVLQGLRGLQAPDAPAGSGFRYSNLGYVLLAEALRTITHTSLPVLAQQALFGPLGMAASFLATDGQPHLPAVADTPRTVGDGGWWTSASDLLVWLDALNRDRLGPELTRLVQTPGRLEDGTAVDYAWDVTASPGTAGTSYTHGGNWRGWAAKTVRRPATCTAVALLTCSTDVEGVSRAAVDLHGSLTIG